MPATTYDIMTAGPASAAAVRPVITKIPAPMIAPMPRDVRLMGPRIRRRRFSPSISACSVSSDFLANNCFQIIENLMAVDDSPVSRAAYMGNDYLVPCRQSQDKTAELRHYLPPSP